MTTFEPRRVGPSLVSGHAWPVTQLARWQKTDGDGRKRTYALGTKRSAGFPDPHVAVFDLTDADTPVYIGPLGNPDPFVPSKRAKVVVGVQNLPITTFISPQTPGGTSPTVLNPCGGGATYSGDLAIVSRDNIGVGGIMTTGVDFYDVTNPAVPCRLGGKAITSTSPGLQLFSVPSFGFAGGVDSIAYDQGLLAFVAIERVGLASVDVGKWIYGASDPIKVEDFRRDTLAPGDYRRVEVGSGRVIAMNRSGVSIDIYDPSLAQIGTIPVALDEELIDMDYVESFQIDRNEDGVIDQNELRNLVFVGGRRGVAVIDVTDFKNLEQLTFVPLPQMVFSVQADRSNRRVLVSANDPNLPANADERIYLLDFSTPKSLTPGDSDGDGDDDRIVWKSPTGLYANGGGRLLAFDEARGLFYTASGDFGRPNPAGIDTWALDSLCCDARIDMSRNNAGKSVSGSREDLIKLEILALQKGMAAGLGRRGQVRRADFARGRHEPGRVDPRAGQRVVHLEDELRAGVPGQLPAGAQRSRLRGLHPRQVLRTGTPGEIAGRLRGADAGGSVHQRRQDAEGDRSRRARRSPSTTSRSSRSGRTASTRARINILPPQNKSGDTSGDLAMGRQQLLLLWLLGGEYVTHPRLQRGGQAARTTSWRR